MWGFLKRQFKTKTGKLMITVAAGAVAGSVPGVGEQLPNAVDALLNGQPLVETLLQTGAVMFLRDGAAKRGE